MRTGLLLLPIVVLLAAAGRADHGTRDRSAQMVKEFGRQGTIEIMAGMAGYFTVGFLMNAADQHLPPDRPALMPALPPLTRSR
jgi:hypothetical protein